MPYHYDPATPPPPHSIRRISNVFSNCACVSACKTCPVGACCRRRRNSSWTVTFPYSGGRCMSVSVIGGDSEKLGFQLISVQKSYPCKCSRSQKFGRWPFVGGLCTSLWSLKVQLQLRKKFACSLSEVRKIASRPRNIDEKSTSLQSLKVQLQSRKHQGTGVKLLSCT